MSGPTTVFVTDPAEYCVAVDHAPQGATINKSPTGNQSWESPPVRAQSPAGCSSTSFAQVGTYYVVCNAYGDNGLKCTGNPFGLYGWSDCGPNDALTVNVVSPAPTLTPIPPPIPPQPTAVCGVYNAATGTTPITWDWTPAQASGLQVAEDFIAGPWFFNFWIGPPEPPHTVSNIPAGTTVGGRTTYDFNTFSSTFTITCPTPPPPTCSISANPASIAYSTASNITWSSTDATSCSISPPGWTGTSGSQSTGSLTSTTTYTCNCSGPGGSGTDSTTVTVVPPPATPTLSCTAFTNPASIVWDWTRSPGPVTYWLQVWGDVWKINEAYIAGPTITTTATPGVPYYGHVLAMGGSQSSDWSNPPNSSLTSCTVPVPLPPTNGACQAFDPVSASTAVKFTGMTGAGMQVVRDLSSCALPFEDQTDPNKWLYVGDATPPKLVSPDPAHHKYMPPGHKICARTTYDWNTFSSAYEVTCPKPLNPAPANISGSLEQKSGTSCHTADAGHTFDVSLISSATDNGCVTSVCKANPPVPPNGILPNPAATDYNCAITFNSRACLDLDTPTWPTSASVSLTNASAAGYSFIGWTDPPGTCQTARTLSIIVDAGSSTPKNLTFNFSGNNWIKTKDTSFNPSFTTGTTAVSVPVWATSFPASNDTGSPYFIIGQAGSTLRTGVSPPTAYSTPNWHDSDSNYSRASPGMNAANFINYVKSRKSYQSIGNLADLANINADGIYVWTGGTLTISDLTKFDPYNVVLISNGEIKIDKEPFKSLKSLAIVADTITFTNITHKATGIFIANTINTGNPVNQGLQIVGNLIALNSFANDRSWSDTSIPSIFVEFDPSQYISLLPYLSIASYDWTQIQ